MTKLAEDSLAKYMEKIGIPVTRESWIEMNWMPDPPKPWTAEYEAMLPEELQDFTKAPPIDTADEGDEEEELEEE